MLTSFICSSRCIGQPKQCSNKIYIIESALALIVVGIGLSILFGGYAPPGASYAFLVPGGIVAVIDLGIFIIKSCQHSKPQQKSLPQIPRPQWAIKDLNAPLHAVFNSSFRNIPYVEEVDNGSTRFTDDAGNFTEDTLIHFKPLFTHKNSPIIRGLDNSGRRFIAISFDILNKEENPIYHAILLLVQSKKDGSEWRQIYRVYSNEDETVVLSCALSPIVKDRKELSWLSKLVTPSGLEIRPTTPLMEEPLREGARPLQSQCYDCRLSDARRELHLRL